MNLKKFVKLIPYLGSFIIFCGVLKLSIYYKSFNIKINDYLDISEILTSFIGDIVYYAVLFIVVGVLFFLAEEKKEIVKFQNTKEKAMLEYSFFKRLKIYTTAHNFIPLFLLVFAQCLLGYFFAKVDLFYVIGLGISVLLIYLIIIIVHEVEKKHFSLSGEKIDPFFIQIILIFILIILLVFVGTFSEIHEVKVKKKYSGTKIQIDETVIISDDQNYFIGKTNKYLFFFKSKLNETEVYPMDRIKMISFLKKDNKK